MSSGRRSWAVALTALATGSVLALGGSALSWAGDDDTYRAGQEMKQDDSTAGQEMKQENSTSGDTGTDTATPSHRASGAQRLRLVERPTGSCCR